MSQATQASSVREARARGEADAAKVRLMGTMDELKARLAPGKLASEAVQAAKDRSIVVADDTVTAVKDKPLMAAGIATAAALFIARKPLVSALGRWVSGGSDADSANTADDEKNNRGRRPALQQEEMNNGEI